MTSFKQKPFLNFWYSFNKLKELKLKMKNKLEHKNLMLLLYLFVVHLPFLPTMFAYTLLNRQTFYLNLCSLLSISRILSFLIDFCCSFIQLPLPLPRFYHGCYHGFYCCYCYFLTIFFYFLLNSGRTLINLLQKIKI